MLEASELLHALSLQDTLKAKLANVEKTIGETAEYVWQEAKGDSVIKIGNRSLSCVKITHVVVKWKEIALDLAGNHPERIMEITESNPGLLNKSVSYQVKLVE